MPTSKPDRRRAPRHPIHAQSVLHPGSESAPIAATTVDVSASGVLLDLGARPASHPGDQVTCELNLPTSADPELPCWGLGRVVRNQGARSAIQLDAAIYSPGKNSLPED